MPRLLAFPSLPLSLLLLGTCLWEAEAAEVPFKDGFPVTSKHALYPLSAVKAGARGVGFTVFRGSEIKPFDVEVLGILTGMLGPHRDVILARLSGPEIEFSGVIAGMSGSPVYIDGKLLGAVSYRFGAFSKEPIAGITPIESMLEIYSDTQIAPKVDRRAEAQAPDVKRRVSVAELRSRELRPLEALPASVRLDGPYDPRPIETPLVLSGFAPELVADLERRLVASGTFVVTTPGGAGKGPSPRKQGRANQNEATVAGGQSAAPIAPGAPIAAVLMRGDLNAGATGTVTYVDQKQVLGFGHPFFGFGRVQFPMATAAILNTLASLAGSSKQAAIALEVGVVEHDRLTAIAGTLGAIAPMVPVRINVRGGKTNRSLAPIVTEVEITDHELWLPLMLGMAIGSATSGRLAEEAGGTVDARVTIKVQDRVLELVDTYSTTPPVRPGMLLAQDVMSLVAMIRNNGIAEAPIDAVEIDVRSRPDVELTWLEEVVPVQTVVSRGQDARFSVRLRPYRSPPISLELKVPIPKDAEEEVEIVIGGAIELDRRDAAVFGERAAEDLDDLLGILAERRPGHGLYGRLYLRRPGLRASAELYSSLPPSQRLTLAERPGLRQQAVGEAFGPAIRVEHRSVIIGQSTFKLRVVR